ncbi:MAG: hypothetical protein ACR2MP_25025 [Streptosporangiaceae bacterium]
MRAEGHGGDLPAAGAAGPGVDLYVFRQRLSPGGFRPPALLARQAGRRAGASREGGPQTG